MVLFGKEKVVFGRNGCIWPNGLYMVKWLVFGQNWLYFGKMVVFGQLGCIWQNGSCLAKMGYVWENGNDCIWENWLFWGKIIVFDLIVKYNYNLAP